MNILVDYHHQDLYYSFKMLFEDRLGHSLFKPIGREWYEKGYWNYVSNNDPAVIGQYLGEHEDWYIGHRIKERKDKYLLMEEKKHQYSQKCLTFSQFLDTDIDIMIASIPAHEETFQKLIDDHKPNAKLIRQEGNYPNHPTVCKNIMSSVAKELLNYPEDSHIVFYHQEFDTKLFSKEPAKHYNRITSLMNCMASYPTELELYHRYKSEMQDFEFRMHGIDGEDGNIDRIENLANAIKDAAFIWQTKPTEQDAGHNTSNAMACGRPIITRRTDLSILFDKGVLEHGITAIDLLQPDVLETIRECSQPEKWQQMSAELYKRWHEYSDFNKEAEELRKFFEELR